MELQNFYWYFEKAIPIKICDDIIKFANKKNAETAITGDINKKNSTTQQLEKSKKIRKSNVVWLDEQWIYNLIIPFINTANKNAGWNFEVDWVETTQFTIYKKGQHYDWHKDQHVINTNQKIRKLSLSINLTDAKNYKGGEFEFCFKNERPGQKDKIHVCKELESKGSLIVFPSFIWHRVKPVTKGTRFSLVAWNSGPLYR